MVVIGAGWLAVAAAVVSRSVVAAVSMVRGKRRDERVDGTEVLCVKRGLLAKLKVTVPVYTVPAGGVESDLSAENFKHMAINTK